MWHDEHDEGTYFRYFTYLNLFMFCMINLVLADNFLLMFLGWEGVGLCSYLLIAFWFSTKEFAIAGKKAFITNRIGDFFFAIGMLLLIVNLGKHGMWSVKYTDVFAFFFSWDVRPNPPRFLYMSGFLTPWPAPLRSAR